MIEAGFGTLVGSDCRAIVSGVRKLTATDQRQLLPAENPFGRGDASEQIAAHLMNCVSNRQPQLVAA